MYRPLPVLRSGALALTVAVTLLASPTPSFSDDFVVNTSNDADDQLCDAGHCSLREAIVAANNHRGADRILFAIPATDAGCTRAVCTIRVSRALPAIEDGETEIDGLSQMSQGTSNPQGPEIEITGTPGPATFEGLQVWSWNNRIHDLVVNHFTVGIRLSLGNPAASELGPIHGGANHVYNNYVGTDIKGTVALPNDIGIEVLWGERNQIYGNVVSGNTRVGIGLGGRETMNTLVYDNLVGTDPTGNHPVANKIGVQTFYADSSVIGPGNVISGNTSWGVMDVALATRVHRNIIGTRRSGDWELPNESGVFLGYYARNAEVTHNLISGNRRHGVRVEFGARMMRIRENRIGTGLYGLRAIRNGGHGVLMDGGGGTFSEPSVISGNVVSGNGGSGVVLSGPRAHNIRLERNKIGTEPGGIPQLGNTDDGVLVQGGATGIHIIENTIAGNRKAGVRVAGRNTNRITIETNSIFANGGLGIELVGGANNGARPPGVFAVPPASPGGVRVLCGQAPAGAKVELFRNSQADSSGEGEGETYLGSGVVFPLPLLPPSPGTPIGQYCVPVTGVNVGDWITATVTAGEDTSAFSTALRVSQ